MGHYRYPNKVRLIIGLLAEDLASLEYAVKKLQIEFGVIDSQLEPILFESTNYYVDELGKAPWRTFIDFEKLIEREKLVEIKRRTNELEFEWFDGSRKVNIDPGYLTLGQFFLATTKDQRQRVYIAHGIFMDPTLYFKNKEYHWYDWTYHDYRSSAYHNYFKAVRVKYHRQLKLEH